MSAAGKPFIGLVPPQPTRPKSHFNGPAGVSPLLRDQLSITSWLSLGAIAQGVLFLVAGRLALLPAVGLMLYRAFTAYAMSVGWMHNVYMDDVLMKKYSGQIPNAQGEYGTKPADSDIVVLLIGTRCNHPMGALAPGFKQLGDFFAQMVKDVEDHAEEFDFAGMTSWINNNRRATGNELMLVGYFKTTEGLHAFAHSEYHRKGWDWWNKNYKSYPHLGIYHEVYHAPSGHWENIYVNSHISGINTTTYKYIDQKTGEDMWASPVVDASKGLLRTSAGRMSRSKADEHDAYGENPY